MTDLSFQSMYAVIAKTSPKTVLTIPQKGSLFVDINIDWDKNQFEHEVDSPGGGVRYESFDPPSLTGHDYRRTGVKTFLSVKGVEINQRDTFFTIYSGNPAVWELTSELFSIKPKHCNRRIQAAFDLVYAIIFQLKPDEIVTLLDLYNRSIYLHGYRQGECKMKSEFRQLLGIR